MEEIKCNSCGTPGLDKALYCYQCGNQMRCKGCLETLIENAKHCITCGLAVSENYGQEVPKQINSIKFKENKEERFYEIEFTNGVGKEIKEVVADLLKNKIGQGTEQHFTLNEEMTNTNPNIRRLEPNIINQHAGDNLPDVALATNSKERSGDLLNKKLIEYPHLNDLEIKLDCRENEWLLLYAFYSSDYGNATFTKEVVWQKYKNKRLTETRFKNLGTNWKSLFKKYICTVKENEFKFTSQGLAKAEDLLLAATHGTKAIGRAPRKILTYAHSSNNAHKSLPLSRKVMASTIVADEFDVYKNEYKISLEDFFNHKIPGSGNPNRIVTIAYYITKMNHQEYFTEGNIDFAYRILKLTGKPVHLKQVIINLKNDRVWFQKVVDGGTTGWRLTRQAEIYVEEKLPPVA